jgi:hypothetical protein
VWLFILNDIEMSLVAQRKNLNAQKRLEKISFIENADSFAALRMIKKITHKSIIN